jgi:hypothetical protein
MSQGKRGKDSKRRLRRGIQLTGGEGNSYQEERDTGNSRGILVAWGSRREIRVEREKTQQYHKERNTDNRGRGIQLLEEVKFK